MQGERVTLLWTESAPYIARLPVYKTICEVELEGAKGLSTLHC